MCVCFFYRISPLFLEVLSSVVCTVLFVFQCSFMYSSASERWVILSPIPSPLRQTFATPKELFALSQLGWGGDAPGIWWIEARDAAEHRVMHRGVPTAKSSLSRSSNRAEVEKPWYRVFYFYYQQVCGICICPYFIYKGKRLVCITKKLVTEVSWNVYVLTPGTAFFQWIMQAQNCVPIELLHR